MNKLAVIILGAGKGTRIKATNNLNKVVYKLNGKPMIDYSVSLFESLKISPIIAVVGYASSSVKQILKHRVIYAVQKQQLGTGHALKIGFAKVPHDTQDVLSVYGDDSAFYTQKLIKSLVKTHHQTNSDITFVTIEKQHPQGMGRIYRDSQGKVLAIVEEKNATSEQKKIIEINTGLYCFKKSFLYKYLDKIKLNPVSHEYYLTDLIEIAISGHRKVTTLKWPDKNIWFGVNTREELEQAVKLKKSRHV